MGKKPLVMALVGPTGSGKSRTSLVVGKALDAEIVSMDSMQIYRRMDIGTAKASKEEQHILPHHMLDIIEPTETFTVSEYREKASAEIDDILARGKMPLLVGGTGLYLNALSFEMSLGDRGADNAVRNRLDAIAREEGGPEKLHAMLEKIDPETASKLHQNDIRRVCRALEIFETSGKLKSEQRGEEKQEGPYHVLVYGLTLPRDQMYAKINARVDAMMKEGLIEEVKALLKEGVEPRREGGAMQAIGYKEIVSALQGEISMERAVELIKQNSRRYAKRQWTWFRHDPRTVWFDFTEYVSREALEQALLESMKADRDAWYKD